MMNQETFFCFGASMKMFLLNSFNKQALRPQKPRVFFIGLKPWDISTFDMLKLQRPFDFKMLDGAICIDSKLGNQMVPHEQNKPNGVYLLVTLVQKWCTNGQSSNMKKKECNEFWTREWISRSVCYLPSFSSSRHTRHTRTPPVRKLQGLLGRVLRSREDFELMVSECFLTCSWRFLSYNKLEQL